MSNIETPVRFPSRASPASSDPAFIRLFLVSFPSFYPGDSCSICGSTTTLCSAERVSHGPIEAEPTESSCLYMSSSLCPHISTASDKLKTNQMQMQIPTCKMSTIRLHNLAEITTGKRPNSQSTTHPQPRPPLGLPIHPHPNTPRPNGKPPPPVRINDHLPPSPAENVRPPLPGMVRSDIHPFHIERGIRSVEDHGETSTARVGRVAEARPS